MPLTKKGEEIMASMKKEYGEGEGEKVFYMSKNAGVITGVDNDTPDPTILIDGKGPTQVLDSMAEQIGSLGGAVSGLVRRMDARKRGDAQGETFIKEVNGYKIYSRENPGGLLYVVKKVGQMGNRTTFSTVEQASTWAERQK